MIERPPQIDIEKLAGIIFSPPYGKDTYLNSLLEKINENYEYWDTVKYKNLPPGFTPLDLWHWVKASRMPNCTTVSHKFGLELTTTSHMQRLCHEFDMNFGGTWQSDVPLTDKNRERYLVGSLMEEAIFSSQMEGASTTRKVAKEMLRNNITPKGKSQQMIANNYQTIQFISEHKEEPLTEEMLLQIHQLMTEGTLQNPEDAGRFRQNDEVVVEDGITHEVVHTPPSYTEIPAFVKEICDFFNAQDAEPFIHPIIRGIVVHFMISWLHPFTDGNGRTARAVFYWYMLRRGYWLTEYMSISRVIATSKKSYEKAFLYTEADGMDVSYFVNYNLHVLEQAFKQLQQYIERKERERQASTSYLKLGDLNERQAQIIWMFSEGNKQVVTVKELQGYFGVSATTAKTDVMALVNRGILKEIAFNKVKNGYIKGERFSEIVNR